MERAEIISQILAILEDVAEVSPEDVNENSVLMDDLDLSSMEILTIVADLEPAHPRKGAAQLCDYGGSGGLSGGKRGVTVHE